MGPSLIFYTTDSIEMLIWANIMADCDGPLTPLAMYIIINRIPLIVMQGGNALGSIL